MFLKADCVITGKRKIKQIFLTITSAMKMFTIIICHLFPSTPDLAKSLFQSSQVQIKNKSIQLFFEISKRIKNE